MKKKKVELPVQQMIVTIVTVIAMITVILLTISEIYNFSGQYDKLMSEYYENIHHMNHISVYLYRHEATIYEQFTLLDEKSEISRTESDKLESAAREDLQALGIAMKGKPYESYYHSIASSCSNYFKSVEYVYDFLYSGDVTTAQYYMDQSLKLDLSVTNENIETLSNLIHHDMDNAKDKMYHTIKHVYVNSAIFAFIIIILGVISIAITRNISNSIAYRDSLTKAGNHEFVMKTGAKLDRIGKLWRYSFLSLSIKDFKYFNNNLGGDVGDQILKSYAQSLKNFLHADEYMGRISGDNFTVLMKKDNVDEFLERIRFIDINTDDSEKSSFVTVYSRCGIYRIQKGDDIYTAFNRANLALSCARNSKTDDFAVFTEDMMESILDAKNIATEFRQALAVGEFEVYYQPRVDIKENMLCGAEALVRWNKNGSILMPDSFIPALENEGCITDLDLYVFERVCSDIRSWMDKELGVVRVSSNFSILNLKRSDLVEELVERTDRFGISKSLLEVEFPSVCSSDLIGTLKRYTEELRNCNIHVSLDNFGSGYSSILLVKELNINGVKLDRCLLKDMAENNQDTISSNLYKNAVHLIKDLGRRIVCVGVEDCEQVEFLRSINCHTVQGYYYDKPLTAKEFAERLTKKKYPD